MGLMDLTGERDGPPLRVPVPLIDFMTGMYAAPVGAGGSVAG